MNEDFIKGLGYTGLATRLKRISDTMIHSGRQMYKFTNMDIEPNWYLVFKLLRKYETLSVTEIAEKLRFAHPSVITIVKKMKDKNYLVSYTNPDDTRKQQFKLSEKALKRLPEFEELWAYGKKWLENLFKNNCLLEELDKLENALTEKSFKDRTLENYLPERKIEIIPFSEEYAIDFGALNYEWLNQYFEVEEHDKVQLDQPVENIINKGGHIIIAINSQKQAVGTAALIKIDEEVYELAKMAVTPAYKGYKIGNQLMIKAIELAKKIKAKKIILESNTKLVPAINLYRKFGFTEIPIDPDSPYERSNIKMEFKIKQ